MNLMANGSRGVGVLTDVQDTGMTVNDMEIRVRLVFRIEPIDGSAPFQAEKKTFVNRVKVPQIGARYPVFYDPADTDTFAFVDGIADESGRANIVAMFGDAFGADASGVGMPAAAVAAAAPAPAAEDHLDKLKKLADLHAAGVLTDDEFAAQKASILAAS